MVRPPEAWLGRWQLDPATLRYEDGRPGRRELAPDGTCITFTQSGTTLDGRPFKNRSVYYRV